MDELPGIERGQVTEVLSRADEENWHLQFLLDGKDYSPTGGAVQLGQEDAGAFHRLLEGFGLSQAVLACGGIQSEDYLMGR